MRDDVQQEIMAEETEQKVYVTQPLIPPLEEFIPYLQKIWNSKWLTNGGPYHQELESRLAEYLGVKHLALCVNGTIALVTALQALRIKGEVITTPYSFVATAHSLLWNSLTPVFVDVDPQTCNLCPEKIEEAITSKTTAIMPVHCYGNPCNVEHIQQIADTYGLKVIYDAAHAFGVNYKGSSLLCHGDLSVMSFHATKVFNTFEGGAIVCPDAKTKKRIDYLKNFGHAGEVTVVAPGINGKMNELQAAYGLLQLQHIERAIARRGKIDQLYRVLLENVKGLSFLEYHPEANRNYSYFTIFINEDCQVDRDTLYEKLREKNIYVRRYFYPLISEFPMYRGLLSANSENLKAASDISSRVLCLPIYPDMSDGDVERIAGLILMFAGRKS